MRIGVYVCHCGGNISEVVDVEAVREFANSQGDVVLAKDYSHLCSEVGQKMIADDIKEYKLDRVLVSACSPLFHGKTFMNVAEKGGLNPYLIEMANIREHCAWAHFDSPDIATEKAKDLTKIGIEKLRESEALKPIRLPVGNRVLIIGGGIAGIQAALDLGNAGYSVSLVEQKATIGGRMAQLSRTFPTNDCAACILGAKMADVQTNPNITLYTYSEIEDITGSLGNFRVRLKRKPTYVNPSACVSCGLCSDVCPVSVDDEYQWNISKRKAIYLPLDFAVPNKYLIDENACLNIKARRKSGRTTVCRLCEKACPQDAICFDQKKESVEFSVDTIIVATGYDVFDATRKYEYGYGRFENVMIAPEVERIIVQSAEGKPVKDMGRRIAFIQCVGSRDAQLGREYCSRVCCMYATKLSQLLMYSGILAGQEKEIYVFYTDMRTFGKGYEEYYKATQKMGVKFIRGRPAEVTEDPLTKKLTVKVEDTLNREIIESEFDTVVLSVGLELSKGGNRIAEILKLSKSEDGFLQEAHPKFRPVDTQIDGIFIAGTAQGPKDIPDTVAQASATAARAMRLMSRGYVELEPVRAFVHSDLCDGCGECVDSCPVSAIGMEGVRGRRLAVINEGICKGCGLCIASCHSDALDLRMFNNRELEEEVKAALFSKKEGEKRIIVFADTMCTYRLADSVGTAKRVYPEGVRIIRVPSSSRVTPKLILKSFSMGADAVFLGDCEAKSTPYPGSIEATERNVRFVKGLLGEVGINPERLRFFQFVTVMLAKFVGLMNEMVSIASEGRDISEEERRSIETNMDRWLFPEFVDR